MAQDSPPVTASSLVGDALDRARARIRPAVSSLAGTLLPTDMVVLHGAFHRAESLAELALNTARSQVTPAYLAELDEQIADEARHVAVFDAWLPPGPREPMPPLGKRRPEAIWFAVLLINEIAGFCQFEMLAALDEDPARVQAIEAIAADERRHIERLVRWLAPMRGRPMAREIATIARTFQDQIDVRMAQFLPRDGLEGLRIVVGTTIVDLIDELVVARATPASFVAHSVIAARKRPTAS